MFNGVVCDSGHALRSQGVRASCRSPRVCLDNFSQSERGSYPCNVLAEGICDGRLYHNILATHGEQISCFCETAIPILHH